VRGVGRARSAAEHPGLERVQPSGRPYDPRAARRGARQGASRFHHGHRSVQQSGGPAVEPGRPRFLRFRADRAIVLSVGKLRRLAHSLFVSPDSMRNRVQGAETTLLTLRISARRQSAHVRPPRLPSHVRGGRGARQATNDPRDYAGGGVVAAATSTGSGRGTRAGRPAARHPPATSSWPAARLADPPSRTPQTVDAPQASSGPCPRLRLAPFDARRR
jgi:hypothetical protein